jgi:hypothetical protein
MEVVGREVHCREVEVVDRAAVIGAPGEAATDGGDGRGRAEQIRAAVVRRPGIECADATRTRAAGRPVASRSSVAVNCVEKSATLVICAVVDVQTSFVPDMMTT